MTESEAFEQFHEELKLDPDELAFARGFPDEIQAALAIEGVVVAYSFLQGSLARGTMVSPLKDVDMVVSLDREAYRHLLDDPLGSDKAMDLFQDALERQLRGKYPNLVFGERKAHALSIELGDGDPSFDLVPAFETTSDDDDVLIADRNDRRWERSNTRELTRVVATANQKVGGKLIHVVRMVKHAVRTKLHEGFPGLAVESLAIPAIDTQMGYAEACLRVFEEGASRLGRTIIDPTGRDDLAPKIDAIEPGFTHNAKQWFESEAADARRAHERAVDGDHDEAVVWWFRVFGSPFSSPADSVSEKAAASALSFGVSAPRPTRSWQNSS